MAQYTLWDSFQNPAKKPEVKSVCLYQGPKELLHYWQEKLGVLTVPQLKAWCVPLSSMLDGCELNVKTTIGKVLDSITFDKVLFSKKSVTKAEVLYVLSAFLSDQRNLQLYVDSLSNEQRVLWQTLLTNLYCSEKQLCGWNGKEDTKEPSVFEYNPISYKQWLLCLNGRRHSTPNSKSDGFYYMYKDSTTRYYYLPASLRMCFAPFFLSQAEVPDNDELPGDDLFVFNGESSFVRSFPVMQMLYVQGGLGTGKRKISASLSKKLKEQLFLDEFFNTGWVPEDKAQMRLSLAIPAVSMMFENYGGYKNANVEDFVKKIESYLLHSYARYMSLLLPHVRGIKTSWYNTSTIYLLVSQVLDALRKGEGKWFPMQNLHYLFFTESLTSNPLQLFGLYDLANSTAIDSTSERYILLSDIVRCMGLPFVNGIIFMMASLGFVEFAWRRPGDEETTPAFVPEYFRLTELGRFALGLTASYEGSANKASEKLFHLDEQRLIIRSLVKNNPYESLLKDTAVSIGNSRYMMDNTSFLRTCFSKEDVVNKINMFRRFISKDIPEHWNEFFESLLRQCNPLASVDSHKYLLFQLDSGNTALAELLSTDPELKAIVIRAEGYRILVEAANRSLFSALMKKHGYLL